jgi:predicted Zn-dependent protease
MKNRSRILVAALGAITCLIATPRVHAGKEALELRAPQKNYLTHEPLLVTIRSNGVKSSLPAADKSDAALLRFDVKPAVKARPAIKPLLVESKVDGKAGPVASRRYDLLEWFQFPAEGTFTVTALLQADGASYVSEPITFTIRRPGKGDKEAGPVDRLHHLPWCSYVADAFCGDTFDLVKQWPDSQLAVYAHYWSGLHLQHKKENAKAVDSFQIVVSRYPTSVVTPAARIGLAEALLATGKRSDARATLEPFFQKGDTATLATDSERIAATSLKRLIDSAK